MIVAPHPDDEVFGAGGLIALKRESGIPVTVVFLTDGEASHRNCCNIKSVNVARNRRRIAYEAAHCIGLDPHSESWVDLPDGNIPRLGTNGFDQAVVKVLEQLDKTSAQEIYCPHPLDCWPDHVAASEIVREVVYRYERQCELFYYLVWAWHNQSLRRLMKLGWSNSWRLDIRQVFERKQTAIRQYFDDCAPCGNPWSGVLPLELLRAFRWNKELFFEADVADGTCPPDQISAGTRTEQT